MGKTTALIATIVAVLAAEGSHVPPLGLDHVWIMVSPGAPERAALEKAGFRIAPEVNRHDGQGTASVTVEFLNRYLELMYLDSTVEVSPGLEGAVKKFQRKTAWRETHASPIGIGTHRTSSTPATFPFPTWKITADWMPKGASMEILSPREISNAPSLFVTADPVDEAVNRRLAADPAKRAKFRHPNGTHEMTSVRVVARDAADLPPAAKYLSDAGVAKFDIGPEWLLEITLDAGKQGVTRDLRPDLPVVVKY